MNSASRALSRIFSLVLIVGSVSILQVVVASPASAADSCGSDWHKQSDGDMVGSKSEARHNRTIKASVDGWVRFCTRERTFYDQRDQGVVIGIPERMDSNGLYGGGARTQPLCLTQKVKVYAINVDDGFSMGSSIGYPGGITAEWSESYTSDTVTISRRLCSGVGDGNSLSIRTPAEVTVKMNNKGCYYNGSTFSQGCFFYPRIEKVVVTTTATTAYKDSGTTYTFDVQQVETDLASQS